MNTERLLKLAEFLETKVPKEQFNMAFWTNDKECGTVCCAGGWACQIPSFKKAGLKMWDGAGHGIPMFLTRINGVEHTYSGFGAMAYFFGISRDDAFWLFSVSNYPKRAIKNPKTVAKRIRELVKENEEIQ